MKEVINIKGEYNESDQLIQHEADVYSFIGSEVFTASGGYQVVRSTFVRERDQKLFESRQRSEGFEPYRMVLLERNPNKPPSNIVRREDWMELLMKAAGCEWDMTDVRLFLEENGYKIVKDGREKESKTTEGNTP